jgi:hypothetical protein
LPETIAQADFRCETGGTSTTCGHSSAIAANYTIYTYRCKFVVRLTFFAGIYVVYLHSVINLIHGPYTWVSSNFIFVGPYQRVFSSGLHKRILPLSCFCGSVEKSFF